VRPEYYQKYDVVRRRDFDPRPSVSQSDSISQRKLNDFICDLQYAVLQDQRAEDRQPSKKRKKGRPPDERAEAGQPPKKRRKVRPQAWQNILNLKYEDFDITEPEDILSLFENCCQLYETLHDVPKSDPYLVPNTEGQNESPDWERVRTLIFTASEAKKVLGLTSIDAKKTFLQDHLWRMNPFKGNEGTRYGQESEPLARRCYELYNQIFSDRKSYVETTGFHISQRDFVLGCSPDGIVKSPIKPDKLLEIKCPFLLKDEDSRKFDEILSKQQLATFPLMRLENGKITLKRTHAHYYQVQMAMDIMKLRTCDYVVWSSVFLVVIKVKYNDHFWAPLRTRLKDIHKELLLPEFWLMRTPRDLPPLEIRFRIVEEK